MSPNAGIPTTTTDCTDMESNQVLVQVVGYGSTTDAIATWQQNQHQHTGEGVSSSNISMSDHRQTLKSSTSSPSRQQINNIGILVSAFLAALSSGAPTYAFGLYAQELKRTLHLTQNQLNTISSATFCAGLLSWIPGMFVDRWGSRLAMIVGGSIQSVALLAYYFASTQFAIWQTSSDITVPSLSLIGIIVFMSNSLVIGALFKMIVQSCANTKGSAVGAAKGYLGLGAGVYSAIFDCMKFTDDLLFLPMASILCIVAIVIPAIMFVPSKDVLSQHLVIEVASTIHFRIIYLGIVVLAMLVLITSYTSLMEMDVQIITISNSTTTDVEYDFDSHITLMEEVEEESSRLMRALWVMIAWFGPIFAIFFINKKSAQSNNDKDDDNTKLASIDMKTGEYNQRSISSSKDNFVSIEENNNSVMFYDDDDDESSEEYNVEEEEDTGGCENQNELSYLVPIDLPTHSNKKPFSSNINNTPDYTLLQMLQTKTAWFLCWTCIIIVGSGTIMTNNMGQMVESLGFAPRTASASLAFFSVAQALARVGVGTLSDAASMMDLSPIRRWWKKCVRGANKRQRRQNNDDVSHGGIPRPAFLVVSALIGMIAHGILAIGTSNDDTNEEDSNGIASTSTSLKIFIVGVIFSGIAFGCIWPLMVLIVGEIFGTKNHGANYMFYDGITSALGTLLISKFLASAVYERNVVDNELTCYGSACFGWAHIAIVALLATCLVSSIAVWRQTSTVYKKKFGVETPRMQQIRSNDELYGSPYRTWRKRDALRYS